MAFAAAKQDRSERPVMDRWLAALPRARSKPAPVREPSRVQLTHDYEALARLSAPLVLSTRRGQAR